MNGATAAFLECAVFESIPKSKMRVNSRRFAISHDDTSIALYPQINSPGPLNGDGDGNIAPQAVNTCANQPFFACINDRLHHHSAPPCETFRSIKACDGYDLAMTPKEILAQIGKGALSIEPARCESFGVWRIRFLANGRCLRDLEVADAKKIANALRHDGNRLLAKRIDISIEEARLRAALDADAISRSGKHRP
jgi:hypothetical protein